MNPDTPFWRAKPLSALTDAEWESLCDGCGKCCLNKLQDEDTDEVYYTAVACSLLDLGSARCCDYSHRLSRVPDCLDLRQLDIALFHWLPATCGYRLVAEGRDLPDWHPLISGDTETVHRSIATVRGRAIHSDEEDLEPHIIHWVDQ